jgi:hypothetical protein
MAPVSYLSKWESSNFTVLRDNLMMYRNRGFTRAAVKVARESNGVLVCATALQKKSLANENVECVTIDRLQGLRKPLVVDNYTLESIFRETDLIVRNLIEENKELRRIAMWKPADLSQLAAWYRSL